MSKSNAELTRVHHTEQVLRAAEVILNAAPAGRPRDWQETLAGFLHDVAEPHLRAKVKITGFGSDPASLKRAIAKTRNLHGCSGRRDLVAAEELTSQILALSDKYFSGQDARDGLAGSLCDLFSCITDKARLPFTPPPTSDSDAGVDPTQLIAAMQPIIAQF